MEARDGLLLKARRSYRTHGIAGTVRALPKPAVNWLFRRYLGPSLDEISRALALTSTDPSDLMRFLVGTVPPSLHTFAEEFAEIWSEVQSRSSRMNMPLPQLWGIDSGTGLVLYSLVRETRPSSVLETGVANGASSQVILSALAKNQHGRLLSTDVSSEVGPLVEEHLKGSWTLRILERPFKRSFRRLLADIDSVDVFHHDSNHDFRWQTFEYSEAFPKIRKGGLFLSDDIDGSYAFLDFVAQRNLSAAALVETRKVLGATKRP